MKIEYKINKNKKIVLYSCLVLSIIVFIFVFTYTFLDNNYFGKGSVSYKNNYYDVLFTNAMIDYDTTTSVLFHDNIIDIDVNDFDIYRLANSINVELYNIGNVDSVIDNIIVYNKLSNVGEENAFVNINLNKGDIIEAGSKKILKIDIANNDNTIENSYLKFSIKLSYKEVIK